MAANGPPQLGADDVVRYASAEHFLDDYRENLALGRMFVRTRRSFTVQSTLRVAIEGPGVEWSVGAEVLVLLSRAGFLGLEFLQFDDQVKPTLDLLVEEVRAGQSARRAPPPPPPARRPMVPREEVTVIGALPSFLPGSVPPEPSDVPIEGTRVEANPLAGRAFADPDTIAGESLRRGSIPSGGQPTLPPEAQPPPARASRAVDDSDDDGESLGMLRRPPAFVMPKTRAEVEAERASRGMAMPKTRAEVEAERSGARPRPSAAELGRPSAAEIPGLSGLRPRTSGEDSGARARLGGEDSGARARLGGSGEDSGSRPRFADEPIERPGLRSGGTLSLRPPPDEAARSGRGDVEAEALTRTRDEPERARAPAPRYDSDLEEISGIVPLDDDDSDDDDSEDLYAPAPTAQTPMLDRAAIDRALQDRAGVDRPWTQSDPSAPTAPPPPLVAPPRLGASALVEIPMTEALSAARQSVPPPASASARTLPPPAPSSAAALRSVIPPAAPARSAPSLVDDLAPAPPAAPSTPPQPAITAEGVDAFDALPGLRATAGGVVRVPDPTELLGVYLAQIRHGVIGFCGGPAGEVGREVTIKLASRRVVSVPGTITARIGAWVYVALTDTSEIRELLRDTADDWRAALDALTGAPPAAALAPPPAAPPSEPPAPAPVVSVAAASVAPLASGAEVFSVPAPFDERSPIPPSLAASLPAPAAPEPARPLVFDEAGPPQPGRLEGESIVFRGPKDLDHEVQSNLKNGGLIALSSPLPIRTHKSLRVVVGPLELGVRIEADVVYAAGGRVGFAVTSFADAASALERLIKQGIGAAPAPSLAASIPPASTGSASVAPPPGGAGATAPPPAEGGEIFGKLSRSLSPGDLLDLNSLRVDSDAELDDVSALVAFDHVTKKKARGVFHLKRSNGDVTTIYLHEGSVAFVDAKPWSEDHALGRIFYAQKKLTEPQVRDAVERSKRERRPFGKTLLALGLVNANALVVALREQVRLKVEPAFDWEQGSFELQPWSEPPTRADLVLTSGQGVVVKYVRHVFERMTSNEIEDLLAPNLTRVVGLTNEVDPTSPLFAFQPKELRFLQAWVDGKRNLSDVVTGSPVGRLASLRLVGFGLAMNLLRFTDGKRALGARSTQPRRSTDGRGYGAMKRQVEEDVKILRGQNYFDVLGVHWSAHHRSYPAAYQKARARFDVTRGELRDAPPPVLALAKEASSIVEAAFKKLANEEERIKYRKQLFDQTEREYSADMLIKQAEVLSMRGDRIGAIEAFETAVELAPTARNRTMLAQAREGRGP